VKSWLIVLGGLIVWAVHFFGVYALAEIAPDRVLVLVLSAVCLLADAVLLRSGLRLPTPDGFARWRRSSAITGALLSMVAVAWQSLPALLS